ncbi:MAG: ABC-type nickel/cobalt efflux system, permease component RcnA [Pseudomonas sp.]|nr:ABC-type nickel/cobalt efflux system, permease component RcnA [Pseudomonas sp.]
MGELLILGFLLGMRHSMEADHVAAVATLTTRSRSTREAILLGAVWGLGHTITLLVVFCLVLSMNGVVPERLAEGLEGVVGVMLILLGLDLVRRMLRERIHFHVHQHGDSPPHFHAHSHAGETGPHTVHHEHPHTRYFPLRALCVGLMHGLAGSAALILLTLGRVATPMTGLAYVALFGIGSIGGMALLSLIISIPLHSVRNVAWLWNGLQALVAMVTIGIGSLLVYQNYWV